MSNNANQKNNKKIQITHDSQLKQGVYEIFSCENSKNTEYKRPEIHKKKKNKK